MNQLFSQFHEMFSEIQAQYTLTPTQREDNVFACVCPTDTREQKILYGSHGQGSPYHTRTQLHSPFLYKKPTVHNPNFHSPPHPTFPLCTKTLPPPKNNSMGNDQLAVSQEGCSQILGPYKIHYHSKKMHDNQKVRLKFNIEYQAISGSGTGCNNSQEILTTFTTSGLPVCIRVHWTSGTGSVSGVTLVESRSTGSARTAHQFLSSRALWWRLVDVRLHYTGAHHHDAWRKQFWSPLITHSKIAGRNCFQS